MRWPGVISRRLTWVWAFSFSESGCHYVGFFFLQFWHNSGMQMRMIIGFISIFAIIAGEVVHAGEAPQGDQVYLSPEAYVEQAFEHDTPSQEMLWPDTALRAELKQVLGHSPSLRFRYWGGEGKTVWILDEVGKDRPITAGVTIDHGKIEDIKVLVFRESRGWEIKHNFFTRQFANLWLKADQQLSEPVDNITGATLSVNAMTRMARAALLMHQYTPHAGTTLADAR